MRGTRGRGGDTRSAQGEVATRQLGRGVPSPADPKPEECKQHPVRQLRDGDDGRHRGRREDNRGRERRTREQRAWDLLEGLGMFRVVSRRAVVQHYFDGHPYAANRTLRDLVDKGLIAIQRVPVGRKAYQVISLTGAGRDIVAAGTRQAAKGVERRGRRRPATVLAGSR